MRKNWRSQLFIATLAAATVAAGGCGDDATSTDTDEAEAPEGDSAGTETSASEDEPIVLRLSHDQNVEHPNTANIELFAEEVESRTDGSVTVDIYPAAQLFGEDEVLPALQRGEVDIALIQPWDTLVPESIIMDVPFIFTSWDQFHQALDGEMGELLTGAFEEHNAKTLYFQDNTVIDLFGTNVRTVHVPSDIEGLRIRTFSEVTSEAINVWGGSATQIPGAETYTAVQRGTVDGIVSGLSFYERKFYEVTPYITQIPISYSSTPLQMNLDRWNELTAEQQEAIEAASQVALESNREETPTVNEEAYAELAELSDEFYVATPEEIAQWEQASTELRDWYIDQAGGAGTEILEAIDSAR